MTTLRDIRRRIHSVENVQQITKAMEMVAVARLNRAKIKAEQSHFYATKLTEVLDHISSASSDVTHPFFVPRKVKKTGVVIVAGDRGLCGAHNTGVFSFADEFLKTYSPDQVELILMGRKTVEHYQSKQWKVRQKIENWGGKISFPKIKELSNQLVEGFLKGELDEIWLIYTHFISTLSRQNVREKFLGFGKPQAEKESFNYIFEPNAEDIYEAVLPRYCISKIQTALDEAYASELAARAFAMRKATNNASDMIENLTLIRNKIRQSSITREMIEIASGAEGTK